MSELREPEADPTRFIRLPDGTIYGYTSLLAKRRDATIVDGYTAAQWFKSQGVENDVTRAFPDTAPLEVRKAARVVLPASAKPNRNVMKAKQREARDLKLAERKRRLDLMNSAPVPPPPVEEADEGQGDAPLTDMVRGLIGDVSHRS